MSNFLFKSFLICCAISTSSLANAQQATVAGKITKVQTGWYGEGLAVHLPATGQLGSGCSEGAGHFAIDATSTGYKEMAAMVVSAFASNSNAQFIVNTSAPCYMLRTKIISVIIEK